MNWDMLGHEWAVTLLKEHILQGQVRHAYLITGPQGVGRRTLALRFAQALNCTQPPAPGEPCRACRACRLTEQMQHPDLAVVQAEQTGGTLKVEQVRELLHSLSLAPYEARYRFSLLLRFEEAHDSAANALLKTLEEPPAQVILAVTAESAERLLPTIVSRCEVIRLRPLPVDLVSQGLEERWNLSFEQARLLAHLSGGRPGYALGLFHDPERLEQRQTWLEDLARLLQSNRVQRFAYVQALTKAKDKEGLRDALLAWSSYWRDVLLRAAGAAAPLINLDRGAEIEAAAACLDLPAASAALAAVEQTLDRLERNVNARLALEVLMLDLPTL